MQAGPRAQAVFMVLRRVLLVLVALELAYLLVANLVLRSQLIQGAVSDAEGFHLELGSAYSLWPGRVHIKDLRLRVEDYNVQFELTLARADVSISLTELPFKKFHATKLDAEGTRFRMRHKLITVGDDAERVAAYPPIAGFADPPYYVGVRPAPIPDAEYDLWEVRIEDVTAQASELWVLEHRFVGEAVARGSFVVRPARWVQVLPAELTLTSGSLQLGKHVVAQSVRGRVQCEVPDMDVQGTEGVQVFREISSRIELKLGGGKLDFLQAYLARLGAARFGGKADWLVDLRLQHGVVQPSSRVALLAAPLVVEHEYAALSGDVMVSLARLTDEQTLALAVNAPTLQASNRRSSAKAPSIEGLRGSLQLHAVDLTAPMSLGAGQVAVQAVKVPDLGWLESGATKLAGSGRGQLQVRRDAAGLLSGQAEVSASDARLTSGAFAASGQLKGELQVAPSSPSSLDLRSFELQLSELLLRSGDKRSQPVSASLSAEGLRVAARGSPSARGPLRIKLSSTEALLPLFVGGVLRDVGSTTLDLKALNGRADLELTPERLALTRIDAHSGRLRVRGHVEQQRRDPTGSLLLSSGPVHVGVTLKDGATELSPFVGDDWLSPPRS